MLLKIVEEKRNDILQIGEEANRRARMIGSDPSFADRDYAIARKAGGGECQESERSFTHLKVLIDAAE